MLCIYPIQSARTHTHTHTPGAVGSHLCCGTQGAVGGSVSCSRAPQSWYWGERALCIHSPTYNSCRTWDSNSQPLGYESDSLTIRPRLPQHCYSPTLVVCIYSITCTACLISQLCVFLGGRELHSDCLALVQAPTVQVESQLTLPLDINNYTISKFVQIHFKVRHA